MASAGKQQITIRVHSGKGGNGAASFQPRRGRRGGGPDGGDGGAGGDVCVRLDSHYESLTHLLERDRYAAGDGERGGKQLRHGKKGEICALPMPAGTEVYGESGEQLCVISKTVPEFILLRGGRGGRGNTFFRSSGMRGPRFSQIGEEGEGLEIRLCLRKYVDFALLGVTNTGKSSLLGALTGAQPKIAEYPYTTRKEMVGICERGNPREDRMTIADLPAIPDDAHGDAPPLSGENRDGGGDGLESMRGFLCVFAPTGKGADAGAAIDHQIDVVLRTLGERAAGDASAPLGVPVLYVLSKCDVLTGDQSVELREAIAARVGGSVYCVSAKSREGLDALREALFTALDL